MHCVNAQVVSNDSNDNSAFVSRVGMSKQMEAQFSFETSGATHPVTQHCMPEDFNPYLFQYFLWEYHF
jgi:hypothetical protein